MRVALDITRRDIAWLNISKLSCLRSNIRLFLLILVGVSFLAWRISDRTGVDINWVIVVFASLGGSVAVFLISLVFVLFSSTAMSGVIGNHIFTIEDAGLREQTKANNTLSYWPAIKKIEKTRSAINVQINPWLFHVMPRRAFGGDEKFDAFFDALVSRHTASSTKD